MNDDLSNYMESLKKFRDDKDSGEYSKYIHGWLIPKLQEMRETGQIRKGRFDQFCNFEQVVGSYGLMIVSGTISENLTWMAMRVDMVLLWSKTRLRIRKELGLKIKGMEYVNRLIMTYHQIFRRVHRW